MSYAIDPRLKTAESAHRAGGGSTANGASASRDTSHGETLVAKFFARNGPNG